MTILNNELINKFIDYGEIFTSGNNNYYHINSNNITINLLDSCNHLGDVLFFTPLVAGLLDCGYNVTSHDNYNLINILFSLNNKNKVNSFHIARSFRPLIRKDIVAPGLINFYSFQIGPAAMNLHNKFLSNLVYEKSLNLVKKNLIHLSKIYKNENLLHCIGDNNFVIVAPSFNSRKFGFYPNSFETAENFYSKIMYYKKLNRKIVLIGEVQADLLAMPVDWKNIADLDLRGLTKWFELPYIFSDSRCEGIISFDTFPYHLSCLMDKSSVLFSRSWIAKYESNWIRSRFMPAF